MTVVPFPHADVALDADFLCELVHWENGRCGLSAKSEDHHVETRVGGTADLNSNEDLSGVASGSTSIYWSIERFRKLRVFAVRGGSTLSTSGGTLCLKNSMTSKSTRRSGRTWREDE